MELIIEKADQAEYKGWFDWQCGYKEAKESGYSDEQTREIANGNSIALGQTAKVSTEVTA